MWRHLDYDWKLAFAQLIPGTISAESAALSPVMIMRFYIIEFGRLDDICDNPFLPDPFVEESVRYEPAFVVMLEMMIAFLVMIMMMKMIPMMLMLMSS